MDLAAGKNTLVAKRKFPVRISTVVGDGEVSRNGSIQHDEQDLICCGKLGPEQACIQFQVALTANRDALAADPENTIDTLRDIFDAYQTPSPAVPVDKKEKSSSPRTDEQLPEKMILGRTEPPGMAQPSNPAENTIARIQAALNRSQGIVIAAPGQGKVPPAVDAYLKTVADAGEKIVVLASSTNAGPIPILEGNRISAGVLDPDMARQLVQLVLAAPNAISVSTSSQTTEDSKNSALPRIKGGEDDSIGGAPIQISPRDLGNKVREVFQDYQANPAALTPQTQKNAKKTGHGNANNHVSSGAQAVAAQTHLPPYCLKKFLLFIFIGKMFRKQKIKTTPIVRLRRRFLRQHFSNRADEKR